jgi:hypothetical protein
VPPLPKFRFQWNNFPTILLSSLAIGLGLQGDSVESLKAKYGQRPKEVFIQDSWSILLEQWLKQDIESQRSLAKALRRRGLGTVEISDDYQYLASCKNTVNLRQETLYVFLAKGEQSQAGQEALIPIVNIPQATSGIETEKARPKSYDRSSMTNFAVHVVASMFELDDDQVYTDKDGDICVPSGSALVFISVIEDVAYRLFSILLSGVTESNELYRVLNEINCNLNIGRIFFINEQIILEHSVMPQSANEGDLTTCISVLTSLADHYDNKLQERFGGKLFLRERAEDEIEV